MNLEEILSGSAQDIAPRLLGCELKRNLNGKTVTVKIVETESYHQSDAASHSFNGKTLRTEVMFGAAGRLYVYFTYGMHFCCNIVTGKIGEGSAVLIRAVEPMANVEAIETYRPQAHGVNVTNGPAKLCQALNINKSLNGHDLSKPPLELVLKQPLQPEEIISTTRIGITREVDKPWRFYINNNPYVSKL